MKRNVDLTFDRKFSSTRFRGFDLRTTLFRETTDIKYPWIMNISKVVGFGDVHNGSVLTGNKKERLEKQRELEYRNALFCECCGERLERKPWKKGRYLLCKNCDYKLEKRIKESYWVQEMKVRKLKVKQLDA